jgi:hypothetical protein
VRRYRRLYARSAYLDGEYKEKIAALVAELRAKYGLDARREGSATPARTPQLQLAFGS